MKKLLLPLFGALLTLPSVARDFDYTYEGQTITYTVLDEEAKTVETKGYQTVSGTLILSSIVSDGNNEYTLTNIGERSFSDCDGLTSVTIPNSVTSISDWAFSACSGLTSVNIPNSVTSISEGTFLGCSGLTSVTIPNSVTSIGEGAFYGCSGLTSVTIPNSVTYIDSNALGGCNSLERIDVEEGNKIYCSVDGVLFNFDKTILLQYPAGKTGQYNIPNSVTSIGEGAFYCCFGLTSVEIPNSVTYIGHSAFYDCSGLTSVEIPNSVTYIGNRAFGICISLERIDVEKGNKNYCSVDGVLFNFDKTTLIQCPVKKNGQYNIPNSVTSIDGLAFSACYGLTSVLIPNSVISIGQQAFYNCSGLTSVVIPNSVTTIGEYAFSFCSGLTSVDIPNSVISIGEQPFYACNRLKLVEIKGDRVLEINNVFESSYYPNILVPQSVIEDYRTQYPEYNFLPIANFVYSGEGDGFEIEECKSATLSLSLEKADIANGFQTDITLPAGLTIAQKDGELDVYFGENTAAESHVIGAAKVDGENKYRIVAYSSKNETFISSENLLNINLVSNNNTGGDIIIDNTEISLIGDISCHPDAMTISVTVTPLYGDSNDNGIVAIDDVVTDVQYILEKNPTPFSFKKADVNRDNRISIIDVSKTVAIILSNVPANAPRRAPAIGLSNSLPGLSAEIVSHSASRKTMAVSLGDVENITALQGDIELPEGVRVTGISLSTEQKSNHKVDFAYIGDNRVRFVVYSLSLARMNGDTPMVEVALDCDSSATDRNVELYGLMASDTDSNLMNFNALSVGISNGTTTGIESVTADDEPVRYFLINGTEVKDVSTPGFYIVRKGGKVSKVMKN